MTGGRAPDNSMQRTALAPPLMLYLQNWRLWFVQSP